MAFVGSLAVFRALRLGDMLCAVPALRALRALRAGFPAARIVLIGLPWAAAFARRFNAYIDDFIAFPGHPELPEQPAHPDRLEAFYRAMQLRRFDLAIQLHGDGRVSNGIVHRFGAGAVAGFCAEGTCRPDHLPYPNRGHEALRLAQLPAFLGMRASLALEFPLDAEDDAELRRSGLAARLPQTPFCCVHPGASRPEKRWPAEHFAAVADRLTEELGLAIVLTAPELDLVAAVADRMRQPALQAAADISVGALAALLARARLLVCNDTGVSHLAAGLRLPSVVVFSDSDIERWAPLDARRHASIWRPTAGDFWLVVEHARRVLRAVPSASPSQQRASRRAVRPPSEARHRS